MSSVGDAGSGPSSCAEVTLQPHREGQASSASQQPALLEDEHSFSGAFLEEGSSTHPNQVRVRTTTAAAAAAALACAHVRVHLCVYAFGHQVLLLLRRASTPGV